MANYSSRLFSPKEDYDTIVKWWESWGWPILPLELLSKFGIIASLGDEDICAVWLYQTDSKFCWVDWYVSNKEISRKERKDGLLFLIKEAIKLAKEMGFYVIFSSISDKNKFLQKELVSCGYGKEEGFTNLSFKIK